MLETAIALTFAHVLADFLFQTKEMVAAKARPHVLLLHGAVVTLLAWTALGFAPLPAPVLLIGLSHLAIDAAKTNLLTRDLGAFLADQAAHLVMIALAVLLFPQTYASGIWSGEATALPAQVLTQIPAAMVLLAGFVAATRAGGFGIGLFMASLPPVAPSAAASLPSGGQVIGFLERALIFLFVLIDEPNAIGFLIAAKSILRFGEIQQDRQAAEYVIIGTLASFGWAVLVSVLTVSALDLLGA